jgi:uncharacterized protein (DUF4415 family)
MSEKNSKKISETDWEALEAMTDDEIDFSDIPRTEKGFFKDAELRLPKPKETISLRVDPEVLAWYKAQGKGYQTRMNAVLRRYMEAQQGKS